MLAAFVFTACVGDYVDPSEEQEETLLESVDLSRVPESLPDAIEFDVSTPEDLAELTRLQEEGSIDYIYGDEEDEYAGVCRTARGCTHCVGGLAIQYTHYYCEWGGYCRGRVLGPCGW